MEHRWYRRRRVTSSIMVYQERIGMIRATVRNVSPDGMLVDMGRYALRKGVVVELTNPTVEGLQGETSRPTALIVHTDDGVAGLMFIGDRRDAAALRMSLEERYDEERHITPGGLRGPLEKREPAYTVLYASRN